MFITAAGKYMVTLNTNLNFTNWHLIPEATHRLVDTNGAPEKFYRLQRP